MGGSSCGPWGVSTRLHARNRRPRRPAEADLREAVAGSPTASLSELRALVLQGQPRDTSPERPGQRGRGEAEGPARHVLQASLRGVSHLLQRGHVPSGTSWRTLYASRDRQGGATGDRGRPSVPCSLVAHVARPSRLRSVGHHPGVGGGVGGENRQRAFRMSTWTGRCPTSRGTSPPTNYTTGPSASSRS